MNDRPTYQQLLDALKALPPKQSTPDQRYWDWWAKYGDLMLRVED